MTSLVLVCSSNDMLVVITLTVICSSWLRHRRYPEKAQKGNHRPFSYSTTKANNCQASWRDIPVFLSQETLSPSTVIAKRGPGQYILSYDVAMSQQLECSSPTTRRWQKSSRTSDEIVVKKNHESLSSFTRHSLFHWNVSPSPANNPYSFSISLSKEYLLTEPTLETRATFPLLSSSLSRRIQCYSWESREFRRIELIARTFDLRLQDNNIVKTGNKSFFPLPNSSKNNKNNNKSRRKEIIKNSESSFFFNDFERKQQKKMCMQNKTWGSQSFVEKAEVLRTLFFRQKGVQDQLCPQTISLLICTDTKMYSKEFFNSLNSISKVNGKWSIWFFNAMRHCMYFV